MVLIHNKSKYTIIAVIEPERRFDCLLESFGCGLSYVCKQCSFKGNCNLCPEIPGQTIYLDADQTENVLTDACFRITTTVVESKEEKIEYVCFFFPIVVEKEERYKKTFNKNITYIKCKQADVVELYVSEGQWNIMKKEPSSKEKKMSKQKESDYDTICDENIDSNNYNEITPDDVGCGCQSKKPKMKKSYRIIMEPNENYDESQE